MIKGKADEKIYTKMKEFLSENYTEPGKIPLNMTTEEIKEDQESDFFESD